MSCFGAKKEESSLREGQRDRETMFAKRRSRKYSVPLEERGTRRECEKEAQENRMLETLNRIEGKIEMMERNLGRSIPMSFYCDKVGLIDQRNDSRRPRNDSLSGKMEMEGPLGWRGRETGKERQRMTGENEENATQYNVKRRKNGSIDHEKFKALEEENKRLKKELAIMQEKIERLSHQYSSGNPQNCLHQPLIDSNLHLSNHRAKQRLSFDSLKAEATPESHFSGVLKPRNHSKDQNRRKFNPERLEMTKTAPAKRVTFAQRPPLKETVFSSIQKQLRLDFC